MTDRSGDWFGKTSALRDLESRVREGQEPRLSEVDRVVRRAHEESVGDLPISRELSAYIENCHNGSIRQPEGAPLKNGDDFLQHEAERLLLLVLEVEQKRRQLRAARQKDPRGKALDAVAKDHNMTRSYLEDRLQVGPRHYNRELWQFQSKAVRQNCSCKGFVPAAACNVDGSPLDPTHPWSHGQD
jgi:hypothetical protein